ncbi:MAG: hypothetical protein JWQ98_3537 [Chlorobi bacterium]|nr:hypothetical protein [Chlorobiota bacterium]
MRGKDGNDAVLSGGWDEKIEREPTSGENGGNGGNGGTVITCIVRTVGTVVADLSGGQVEAKGTKAGMAMEEMAVWGEGLLRAGPRLIKPEVSQPHVLTSGDVSKVESRGGEEYPDTRGGAQRVGGRG